MTTEKKDNLKKINNPEIFGDNVVVKRKVGRPRKNTDGTTVSKKTKSSPKKEKSKKPTIAKKAVSDLRYSEDEEIPVDINIKRKIKTNIDELINVTETLGAEKPIEAITSLPPTITSQIKERAEKNIMSTNDTANTINKASMQTQENSNNNQKENSLWNIESDAVKRVIAAANIEKEREKNVDDAVENKTKQDEHIFNVSAHAVSVYKKIAYFFTFLLVGVGVAVFYFTFIHVKIILIPNQERVNNNTIFDVVDIEKNPDANEVPGERIIGIVKEMSTKFSKKYPTTNEEVLGKEVTGKIKITNNYIKNQPLIASTRVLSTDGKLFRLKNTVNVPANDSVEVEIYADNPTPETAIGPTKFTIPGLWAGLQDKIYGESFEATEYRQKIKKSVSGDDIQNGIKDLKQELLNNAKKEVNNIYSNYDKIIYKIDENSIKSVIGANIGDEITDFDIEMEAMVVVVAFNNKKFAEIAKDKLNKSLTDNKELISFDSENINYSLNNFNVTNGTANVSASFEGMVALKDNVNIIDKEKLIGLNKEQINAYLNDIDKTGNLNLAGHEIKFYPSFITKIPALIEPGRIEIEIGK